MKNCVIHMLLSFLALNAVAGAAQDRTHVATVTQIQGDVQVFSNPGKTIQGPPPHALYEKEYYSVRDAKPGEQVDKGNIVRTAPGGIAKIVYDNGDQVHVGNATAYRVFVEENLKKSQSTFFLLYGKLRGVISKVGPRNNLKVKTSDVVMGVRGTDFFVEHQGIGNQTRVSVLRGAVEVKAQPPVTGSAKAPEAKAIEVKSGETAVVKVEAKLPQQDKQGTAPAPVKFDVQKTDQGVLAEIKANSEIKKPVTEPAKLPEPLVKKIEQLETKAVAATLQDIKATDPKLFAQVAKQNVKSSDELNARTVETMFKEAPPAPKKLKPSRRDLEDVESDSYEKYFKIIN